VASSRGPGPFVSLVVSGVWLGVLALLAYCYLKEMQPIAGIEEPNDGVLAIAWVGSFGALTANFSGTWRTTWSTRSIPPQRSPPRSSSGSWNLAGTYSARSPRSARPSCGIGPSPGRTSARRTGVHLGIIGPPCADGANRPKPG
jgi:hypothetical protein